ncbi:MAG: DUF2306 domain-containing protein [Planctomycetaceae bacterium]|nr:DUF2306 domain-containing protein [Planctomycetaceae bacterium]
MPNPRTSLLIRVLTFAVALLIVKVTMMVVAGYVNYYPPNFQSDFLHGREDYFFTRYQWAFYPHIVSGPLSLLLGLLLISERFRRRFPRWHRYLGRVQTAGVLLVVLPSGLVMAFDAAAGPFATLGFILLTLLTAGAMVLGWQAAVQRRFLIHRRWMQRSYLLLCSAVVLRIIGGIGTVLEVKALSFDLLAGWASWVVPLIVFELYGLRTRRTTRVAP